MIDSFAGSITQVNLHLLFTPEQCLLYESCVRDVLCNVSSCVVFDGSLYVNWIW